MVLDESFCLLAYLDRIIQRKNAVSEFLVFIIGPVAFDFRMLEAAFYGYLPSFVGKIGKASPESFTSRKRFRVSRVKL